MFCLFRNAQVQKNTINIIHHITLMEINYMIIPINIEKDLIKSNPIHK